MAYLYEMQGNYQEAKTLCLKSISIYEATLGEEHPKTVNSYCNLADLYEKQGEYAEAEELYRKVLPIAGRVLGENHDLTREVHDRLASLCGREKKG